MIIKGHIRPLRESLNLSDLSDEEVDRRLTQISREYQLSRNSSTISGNPIHKDNEGL